MFPDQSMEVMRKAREVVHRVVIHGRSTLRICRMLLPLKPTIVLDPQAVQVEFKMNGLLVCFASVNGVIGISIWASTASVPK